MHGKESGLDYYLLGNICIGSIGAAVMFPYHVDVWRTMSYMY